LLVLPFAPHYRPAPPSDAPITRAARRLAARDRDAGIYPRDWPAEDKVRWPFDSKTYRWSAGMHSRPSPTGRAGAERSGED
jgi:hypothetical protein